MSLRIKEKTIQLALYQHYLPKATVIREVVTPVGNIDLVVTNRFGKEMIEVKECKSVKHAIGQLLSYQRHYPCDKLTLAYFHYNPSKAAAINPNYYALATQHNIQLLNTHTLFSNEYLLSLQGDESCTETEKDTTLNGRGMKEATLTFLPQQPFDYLEHLPLPEW